jgi:hypothetical protein
MYHSACILCNVRGLGNREEIHWCFRDYCVTQDKNFFPKYLKRRKIVGDEW